MLAYILAKVEAGKDRDVVYKIKELKEVKSVHATYGTYDMIIEVEFKGVEELDEFVFDKVRKMPGVKGTITVIASKTLV